MAHSRTYFGLRRGSTRSHTFQVVRGQQVTKDRVTDVKNPKSYAQMVQRSRFGYITKFYSSGVRNFFKFAFEDKRPTESDYNAFMRNNIDISPYATKEMLRRTGNPFFAPFMVTKGSLPTLDLEIEYSSDMSDALLYNITADSEDKLTVALASNYFIKDFNLMEGDIITFVMIAGDSAVEPITSIDEARSFRSLVKGEEEAVLDSLDVPYWKIVQFKIDTSSTKKLSEIGFNTYSRSGEWIPCLTTVADVSGAILCVSRPTSAGLKVSTSHIVLASPCQLAYNIGVSAAWGRFCSFNMGGSDDALLKGALL